ncbi:MAG: transporter substrate-binding domain-containing protein [Desulfobacterales bacterium]|nr:transporter substrate-binding domain-containing protein [Desulfobacterales bacterium]
MRQKTILFVFLFLVAGNAAFAANEPQTKDGSPEQPLKIAYCEYMPFYFKGARGQPRGILVDLWKLWSEKAGIPVTFLTLPWDDAISYVRDGKADLNVGIFYTEERDAYLDFSQPFFDLKTALFYNKTLQIPKGIKDLAGRQVGVVTSDFNAQYVKTNQPDAVITEYAGYEQLVRAAMNGEVEAFIMETPVAMTYLSKLDGFDIIHKADRPVHTDLLRAAVAEGNKQLLEIVDKGLSAISARELKSIIQSWTGQSETSGREASLVQNVKKVVIAHSIDSKPFQFVDEKGQSAGMLIDLWRLWSERTNIEVEFKSGNFADSVAFVRNREADIHAGFFTGQSTDEYFDYTDSLYSLTTHFFFRSSIFGLKNLEDLAGFRIGVVKGEHASEYLSEKLPQAALAVFPNNQALFDAVEQGDIRVFVKETAIALAFLKKKEFVHKYRHHPERPLYSKNFHAAVKKGNSSVLSAVNRGLQMISPEERAAVEREWTGASSFKTKDVLVIACTLGYPPFTFLNTDGKPAGMTIDLWRLWSEKTGKQIEFRMTLWDDTLKGMKNGSADIHSGLYRTEARKQWLAFSQPIYQTRSNIFYHVNAKPVSGMTDLTGENAGALRGGYSATFLRENWSDIKLIEFDTSEDIIDAAAHGRIRAFLDEAPSTLDLLNRLGMMGEFSYLKDPLYSKKLFAGVLKRNSKLLDVIDSGIDAMTSEELFEIESRWVPNPDLRYFRHGARQITLTTAEEEWIRSDVAIRVGIGNAMPPVQYVGENGVLKGMVSDYIHILNERLGLHMEPVYNMGWSDVLAGARNGQIDILACAGRTQERETYMNFTHPYISFPSMIITRKNSPFIGELRDLHGKKVAVVRDLFIQDMLKKDYPDMFFHIEDSALEALKAVSLGKADAYVGNLAISGFLMQKHGLANLKIAAPTPYGNIELSFAVHKDRPELFSIIKKGLASVSHGEHDEIRQKWIAVRYEHGVDVAYIRKLAIRALAAALAVLSMFFFWNWQIRRREERFRGLTEHGTDITQAFKKDGTIVYQSPSHKTILGYEQNELVGKSAFDLFHEQDIPQWHEVLDTVLRKQEVYTFVHRIRHKQGHYRYVESNCVNLLRKKALKAIVINARDITERRQTQESLRESNQRIMDSIHYAKMIQRSLLPSQENIKRFFPDSFYIWMPRDIVGGDILFAHYIPGDEKSDGTEKGHFVGAVVDCTGHGIPGAFMTMLACSGLSKTIRDEKCCDPALILKQLNFFVKTLLQQDTEYALSDDGMDAAVVSIDEVSLTFAGARLPLMYVCNDEITVIKGDRQSIGYRRSDLNFNFTNHCIRIEKGMSFYMATDGFHDQHGGEKDRRFGTRRFRELLKKIAGQPFEKQQKILVQTFEDYREENERQDDVTVVGFALS